MRQGKEQNPANTPIKRVTEATRIPMSLPQLKLGVPDVPGFHLHWILGKNIPRALRAGYEFVEFDEVDVANTGIADNPEVSGSTDLGSRVSILAGTELDETNQPERLYLMKLKLEWWEADQAAQLQRSEQIAQQMRSGMPGGDAGLDNSKRYLKAGQDMFLPKR